MEENKAKAVKERSQADRSFKCYCCKRVLKYEAKLQCMFCEQVEVCKLCFKGKYHEQHEFLMKGGPDKDWEPALRDNASNYNDDY
jgi:hypothetical protein